MLMRRQGVLTAVIVLAFLASNAALVISTGVRLAPDSSRYLIGAAKLIEGEPLGTKELRSVVYLALIASSKATGLGLLGVVAVQIAVAGAAAVAAYGLAERLGGRRAGLVAAAATALNPDLSRWHAFVLPESLYTSLVVVSTWSIHRAAEIREAWYAIAIAAIACTVAVRPNGWVFVPVAACYWAACGLRNERARRAAAAAIVLGSFAAIVVLPPLRRGIQVQEPELLLQQGVVIWGYDATNLPMPPAEVGDGGGWLGGLSYVARHPFASLRLAAARVIVEVAHVRPFYSRRHNAAIVVVLIPVYGFATLALVRFKKVPLVQLIGAIVGAHLLIVGLAIADWDGRLLLHVFPLITVLAAGALQLVRPSPPAPGRGTDLG
jgi:hypothetical protein